MSDRGGGYVHTFFGEIIFNFFFEVIHTLTPVGCIYQEAPDIWLWFLLGS
jgi:hypothetical protein